MDAWFGILVLEKVGKNLVISFPLSHNLHRQWRYVCPLGKLLVVTVSTPNGPGIAAVPPFVLEEFIQNTLTVSNGLLVEVSAVQVLHDSPPLNRPISTFEVFVFTDAQFHWL